MDEQGWVDLPVLLKHLRSKPSADQVRQVVTANDKQRFVLDESRDPPRIRAAQGHSVQLEAPVLQPVTSASSVPLAIHVTSKEGWEGMQGSGTLLRMARTHIHFATQPHHVRSNKWASILLKLDLAGALAAGHLFGLSSNGVLLTEGPLPLAFVERVEEASLPVEWQRSARQATAGQEAAPAKGQQAIAGQEATAGQQAAHTSASKGDGCSGL